MKKLISYIIFILIIAVIIYYRQDITDYITKNIIKQEKQEVLKTNEYAKGINYNYVSITSDFKVHKKEDIKNIFYTILDSGSNIFSFQCDTEYKRCTDDIQVFFNDKDTLSHINNYVHPYNSFKNIRITMTNYGKVTLDISHIYQKNEIKAINDIINSFIKDNINDTLNINDKIKVFHDYIVNNTKFDTTVENSDDRLNSASYTAYGLLVNHLAICGGYTDTMAIFLNMLNLPNYRIATQEHVWNFINIDNNWLHLDVTWDDPVTSDGSDMLMYDYYLINTNDLLNKDITQHNFDKNVYIEAK